MDKIKIGDVVFGKVTGIEKYGIFLSLDDNINGLIHISEISNSFVKNVEDYASIGETIKAKVIATSTKDHQLSPNTIVLASGNTNDTRLNNLTIGKEITININKHI